MAHEDRIATERGGEGSTKTAGRRLRRWAVAGVVLAVTAAVVVLALRPQGSSPMSTPTGLSSPSPARAPTLGSVRGAPQVPDTGVLVGAWVKPQQGGKDARLPSTISAYQELAGRRLDIVHVYRTWNEPFPGPAESFAVQQGSTPMISWTGTNTSDIIAGRYDDLIRQRADALRDLNSPVFLRWFWEMDRPDAQGKVGSPADYVAAWRHLRSIFTAEHASNVSWVWCPTSISFARGYGPRYYPGDDAVDWTCSDGYSGGSQSGTRTRSFRQVFQAFYDWASQHPKPIMIGEFGVQKGAGDQGQWLRDAAVTLREDFPQVKAVVYFDSARTGAGGGTLSWSLRDSQTGMSELRSLLKQPYFNTRRLTGLQPN